MPATARTRTDTTAEAAPELDDSDGVDPFADLLPAQAGDTSVDVGEGETDPFADLDGDSETEETLSASRDDLGPVRDLFGTRPPGRRGALPADTRRAVGGSGWPVHNYNDAYRSLQAEAARRGVVPRRRASVRGPHELWEVDDMVGGDASPRAGPSPDDDMIRAALADAPESVPRPSSRSPSADTPAHASSVAGRYPGIPVTHPWPASAHRDPTRDAEEWLDGLEHPDTTSPTVAQLIAGSPRQAGPVPLVDIVQTLYARPRSPRHPIGSMRDVPAAYNPPSFSGRALRVATTIAVTLFALALVQLLILSL